MWRNMIPDQISAPLRIKTSPISKELKFIKSSPTTWWWRLIVFAELARVFGWYFFAFFSFFNKIQDGRQNSISLLSL